MLDAHIADGDLAILVPFCEVGDGAIAVVIVDDLLTEATLKIIRRNQTPRNCIRLASMTRHSSLKGGTGKRTGLSASMWG